LIPFSEIVNIIWQPILRPEIGIGGWFKIITPDNFLCPKFVYPYFEMQNSGHKKIYPSDNCLEYNAGYDYEATESEEKVKNILNIIRHIIGLKEITVINR